MPCWTRAIVGDLEAALADCDEANRLKPNYIYALDSCGFTYLKMGKFLQAIADYDAALKIDPRIAHSLYGRGLAKLKSNDAEGGRVDLVPDGHQHVGLDVGQPGEEALEQVTRAGAEDGPERDVDAVPR